MGNLNVSFEIKYSPDNVVWKDGVEFVDVADTNFLTGMTVVWTPAYADANALEMVAETTNADVSEIDIVAENTSNEGDEKEVPEEILKTEEPVVEQTVAEEAPAVTEEQTPQDVVAEDAEAEVVHHAVRVTEEVIRDEGCDPVHIVETTEVIVETLEDPPAEEVPDYPRIIAEKDERIGILESQIAELNQIKAEYEQMKAAQAAAELAAKQAKAKAFASKQGLDVEDIQVAEAIAKVDYEVIASLVMAKEPEAAPETVTIASYSVAGMEVKSKYGNLLDCHE